MSHIKGFIISFVLSFLAFAVVILYGGSFALTLILEDESQGLEDQENGSMDDDTQNLPVYTSHETFSFALVITDEIPTDDPIPPESGDTSEEIEIPHYMKDFETLLKEHSIYPEHEIKFVCVVSINKTVSKSLVTVIPGDSVATIGDVEMDLTYAELLSKVPALGLGNFIESTVIAHTGVIPDHCGYIDIDDFVKLADELGGVKYKLEKKVTSVSKTSGEEIVIEPGELTLDSETLGVLLEYEGYGSRYARSQTLIDVSKSMLDGICTKFRPNILAKVREMLDYVNTDFTAEDMEEVSSIFFSYQSSEKTGSALLGAYEPFGTGSGRVYLFRVNTKGSVDRFKQYLN